MSERFRALLAEWKRLEHQAHDAQRALNERFQAFLDGTGPEPDASERARVEQLRDRANAALEVAMGYVRSTARGPISRK
jgi:hypothetical protein